ncbi:MAG: site-specific integrase [Bifidobacteriaceae bacterium]|nr:site-specific integrase [Bifidobacteriaceae bacterium]
MKLQNLVIEYSNQMTGVTNDWIQRIRYLTNNLENLYDKKIDQIKPSDISQWIKFLQKKDFSAKTIHNKHGALSQIFSWAVREKIITENPCLYSKLPKINQHEMEILTVDQYYIYLSYVPQEYQLFIKTAFATGARFSELTALTKKDINLERQTFFIHQAWSDRGKTMGPGKTAKARRSIPIHRTLFTELVDYSENLTSKSLLFTKPNGKPITSGYCHKHITGFAQKKMQEYYGIRFRFHDIRHTFVSWLLDFNTPVLTVSRYLGHKSAAFTLDRYGHLLKENREHIDGLFEKISQHTSKKHIQLY